jgi:hypothetical protein
MNDKLIKIQNELNVPKAHFNKFGDYYYRSCEDILEALKPLLEKEGLLLTISDSIESVGDRNYVKATVTLTDGTKSIEVSALAREAVTPKAKTDDSQLTGATSSYARKYALNGLFLIDDTKDSDATNKHETPQPQTSGSPYPASEKQRKLIYLLYKEKNGEEMPEEEKEKIRKLTSKQASDLITKWKAQTEEQPEIRDEDEEAPEIDIDDIPFN